jgi:hypothetical protein
MENGLFFLLFLVGFTFIFWYLIRKWRALREEQSTVNQLQEGYGSSKKNTPPVLPYKERLALSWEPIKKIAEYVTKYFNENDKNQIVGLGEKLLKHGMKYIHVVDFTVPKKIYTRNVENEKEKEQGVDKNQISR